MFIILAYWSFDRVRKYDTIRIFSRIWKFSGYGGLVPDDTSHKGTSKRHKTGEKTPILRCMFLHQYFILKNSPLHPAPIWLCSGLFFLITNVGGETCTALLYFLFGFYPIYIYIYLCGYLTFCVILIHTKVRQVRN